MFKYATSALENLLASEHGYLKKSRMSCLVEANIVQHLYGREPESVRQGGQLNGHEQA